MDALLTQRALAEQIEQQGGYDLLVVKRNQRRLYEDLRLFFEFPAIRADDVMTLRNRFWPRSWQALCSPRMRAQTLRI